MTTTVVLTPKQKERLLAIDDSDKPVTLSSNTRMHNTLLSKGLIEIYRIPSSGVPACYSSIIAYVRLTYIGKKQIGRG